MINLENVIKEFEAAKKMMQNTGPSVSIFGSARTAPSHPHYKAIIAISKGLSEAGYGIISGGGKGLMEAANKGASMGPSSSVGLSIYLPFETCSNDFLDNQVGFNYFFARKVIFVNYSAAFVIAPGGLGTLDEFFEVFTLIQTGKIKKRPIVLFDSVYWNKLIEQLHQMVGYTISAKDMDFIKVLDNPNEVVAYLKENITL